MLRASEGLLLDLVVIVVVVMQAEAYSFKARKQHILLKKAYQNLKTAAYKKWQNSFVVFMKAAEPYSGSTIQSMVEKVRKCW